MNSLKVSVFLAFKSITRGDWRVLLLTVSMLILVYLNLVFTPALLAGAVQNINEKTRDTLSGDLVVQSDNTPVIAGAREMVSEIEQIDGVAGACSRNSLGAEVGHEGDRVICAIYGIDPTEDVKVFGKIADSVVDGSYLEPGDRNQVLLGAQIAGNDRENLELYPSSLKTVHAGDTVTIAYGNGQQKEYTVKGVFFTEFVQSDIRAFITEDEFNSLVPQMNDMATTIHVKLERHVDRDAVIEQIGQIGLVSGQPLKFQTWEDALGVMRSMTASFDQIIAILRAIALIVAAITIFIVTYVDLVNKRRQIGIERAIGITSASIIASYIIRAVFYAVVSILAAALIFVYVVVPVEAVHPFHFPFGDVFLPVNVSYLTYSGLILCAVAIVSAFIPAWQTVRTKIIDAIWSS